jgi:hypothetical protein
MTLDEYAGDGSPSAKGRSRVPGIESMDGINVGSASLLLVVYLAADRIGIRKVLISPVEVPKALREEVAGATRTWTEAHS